MSLVLSADGRHRILAASDDYLTSVGRAREALVGRPLFEAFGDEHPSHGATLASLRASLERVIATGRRDTMDVQRYDISLADGFDERYWSAVNVPVVAADGTLACIVHRVEDATALVRAQAAEAAERAKLVDTQAVLQTMYDQGLFAGRLDLDGRVVDANRASLEGCGFRREDVIGRPFWECGWWNRAPQVQAWVRNAVLQARSGEAVRGETRYFRADGSEHVVDFACLPIRDEHGRTTFLFVTGMDVTERAGARENLHAKDILESITEGFFALDHEWRFIYVNSEALRVLGRTQADLIGTRILDAYPSLAGTDFERAYRRGLVDREAATFTAYDDEHRKWYEVHSYPAPDGISVYFRDVTAMRAADVARQRAVADSERQRRIYEAALSNTPDLVYVFDRAHRFIYANEALLRMWGRTREESLGRTCLELGYEPWHAAMHDREIEEVVATRRSIRGEVPFTGTNGRRVYDYIFVPVIGEGDEVVAVAGTTRDVTERQQIEQSIQAQAAQLQEADRAKDEFLATLAHELRNPLAPLRNGLWLLRGKGAPDPAVARIHEMMQRQVEHLVRLVDDLLETSRISRGALALRTETVDIATIVRNAVETSRPLIDAAHHALSVSLPEAPIRVSGDPVRLAQILSNLLNNAATYTPDGGRIELVVGRDADGVRVIVRDDGAGIAAEDLGRIFAMFRRGDTRGTGGGLGIGLALSRKLAELHHGTLVAHSDGVGRGSTFTLRLPAAAIDAQTAAAPATANGGRAAHDSGSAKAVSAPENGVRRRRVLVVDDNRDAADSLGMVLSLLGADVRVALDGPAALEAYDAHAPAVVLLDIGMPGMDGYDVARGIRARDPARRTALVALTGWGQDEDRRRAREAGFDHHLVKPADMGSLQQLLAGLPDASPERAA